MVTYGLALIPLVKHVEESVSTICPFSWFADNSAAVDDAYFLSSFISYLQNIGPAFGLSSAKKSLYHASPPSVHASLPIPLPQKFTTVT